MDRRGRAWRVALVALVAGLAAGCSQGADAGSRSTAPSTADLSWAGFDSTAGLSVGPSHEEPRGPDRFSQTIVHGRAPDVDAALTAAGFRAPFAAGFRSVQPTEFGFDPAGLRDVRWAKDSWPGSGAKTVERQVIRGTAPDGLESAEITVFTT